MDENSTPNLRGQIFTLEGDMLVVEHYHFGDNVAYEYAEQVRFDRSSQGQIAAAIDLPDSVEPEILLQRLKEQFGTQSAVRDFADAHAITYDLKTDFQP